MDEEEVEIVYFLATCRTEGCGNEGDPVEFSADAPLNIEKEKTRTQCGPCGNWITDIVEKE